MSTGASDVEPDENANPRRCTYGADARTAASSPRTYFPASQPGRYACVHRVFGASNVTRLLQSLPVQERAQAADTVAMEARWRVQDPVYGCAGIISRLQDDTRAVQCNLARTRAQLTVAVHGQQAVSLSPPRPGARHVGMQTQGHHVQETTLLDPDQFLDFGDF